MPTPEDDRPSWAYHPDPTPESIADLAAGLAEMAGFDDAARRRIEAELAAAAARQAAETLVEAMRSVADFSEVAFAPASPELLQGAGVAGFVGYHHRPLDHRGAFAVYKTDSEAHKLADLLEVDLAIDSSRWAPAATDPSTISPQGRRTVFDDQPTLPRFIVPPKSEAAGLCERLDAALFSRVVKSRPSGLAEAVEEAAETMADAAKYRAWAEGRDTGRTPRDGGPRGLFEDAPRDPAAMAAVGMAMLRSLVSAYDA